MGINSVDIYLAIIHINSNYFKTLYLNDKLKLLVETENLLILLEEKRLNLFHHAHFNMFILTIFILKTEKYSKESPR